MIINGILQQLSFTMLEYVLDNSRHKRENVSLATGCFVSGLRKEDNSVTINFTFNQRNEFNGAVLEEINYKW